LSFKFPWHVVSVLVLEKANALREAVGREVKDLLEEVILQLRLCVRSLQMLPDDLEKRLQMWT